MCNLEFDIKQFVLSWMCQLRTSIDEITLKEAERIQGILWRGKPTFVRKQKSSKKGTKLLSVLLSFFKFHPKKQPQRGSSSNLSVNKASNFILKNRPFGGA